MCHAKSCSPLTPNSVHQISICEHDIDLLPQIHSGQPIVPLCPHDSLRTAIPPGTELGMYNGRQGWTDSSMIFLSLDELRGAMYTYI